MFQCIPEMQSSAEASGIGRFPDGPRSIKLRAKMAGLSHPLFKESERKEAGCQHRLFSHKLEYCYNLIFHRGTAIDQLAKDCWMPTAPLANLKKIPMIFGRNVTKYYKGKLQSVIEGLDLTNPVIRSHYGKGFLKQYVRDHLCLRTELATNDVTDYGIKKAVENLPPLRDKLATICDNYLTVQQDILETFVDRGQLRKLTEPTVLPTADGFRA